MQQGQRWCQTSLKSQAQLDEDIGKLKKELDLLKLKPIYEFY
jgi:hypothetical protein